MYSCDNFDIFEQEQFVNDFNSRKLKQLISVILYHRLFFFHCYDLVWYKELDLKPYWSQVCTVGWRYKTWTPFWT